MPSTAAQPVESGDWLVTSQETFTDQSIALNGNLTVKPGGHLTLRNVALSVVVAWDGQHGIRVEPGGSLDVEGGSIRPANPDKRISFVAEGSLLRIERTAIDGAGRCVGHFLGCVEERPELSGLLVRTEGATIRNSTIRGGGIGVEIAADNVTMEGNSVEKNDRCGVWISSDHVRLVRNTVWQSAMVAPDPACVLRITGASDVKVENNIFEERPFLPGDPAQGGAEGVITKGVVGVLFANNTIVAQRGLGMLEASNTIARNNTVRCGEMCLAITRGQNNRVEENHLDGVGFVFGTMWDGILAAQTVATALVGNDVTLRTHALYGIRLRDFHDGWVVGNRILGDSTHPETSPAGLRLDNPAGPDGILLQHSANNTVAGNNIRALAGGIFLFGGADGNRITGNVLETSRGITIASSDRNLVSGNSIDDAMFGSHDSGRNEWSSGSRGNFWAAHPEETTHLVGPNGVDRFPLVGHPPAVESPVPAFRPMALVPTDFDSIGETRVTLIEDTSLELAQGTWGPGEPHGALHIRNSTLSLGRTGPVVLRGYHLIIEDSRLVAAPRGYGFGIGTSTGEGGSIVVRNTRLEGVTLEDADPPELLFENVTITNTTMTTFHPARSTPMHSIRILNSTYENVMRPLFIGSVEVAEVVGNHFGEAVELAVDVGVDPGQPSDRMSSITIEGNAIDRVWKGDGIRAGAPLALAKASIRDNVVRNALGGIVVGTGDFRLSGNVICGSLWSQAEGAGAWNGNFYEDYAGADANGDGVGDTAYRFSDTGGTDPSPLYRPPGEIRCDSRKSPTVNAPPSLSSIGPPKDSRPDLSPDISGRNRSIAAPDLEVSFLAVAALACLRARRRT